MNFKLKKSLSVAAIMISILAVKGWSTPREVTINFEEILRSHLSANEKSDQITTLAERLVYSDGLPFALNHFQIAKSLNPNNLKADFYISFLKIIELQKGILSRTIVVANQLAINQQKDYYNYVSKLPSGNINTWAHKAYPDMRDEKDIQKQVALTIDGLTSFREKMSQLRDKKAKFTLNIFKLKNSNSTGAAVIQYCPVKQLSPNIYNVSACPYQKRWVATLDFDDFEALRLVAGGIIAQLAPTVGYSIEGTLRVAQKLGPYKYLTHKIIAKALQTEFKLGTLQNPEYLKLVGQMGAEAVEGYRMASQLQKEFCDTGSAENQNRPGQLFSYGFCVTHKLNQIVELSAKSLSGPVPLTFFNYDGVTTRTAYNLLPILNGQVRDLKSQIPNSFDRCGHTIHLADQTLAGVFPNHDAEKVFMLYDRNSLKPCN